MMVLLEWLWAWLDGFIFGRAVRVECEYCSYVLSEDDCDAFEDEDAFVVTILEHPCPVKSRRQLRMVVRRFGFWENTHIISKPLWER